MTGRVLIVDDDAAMRGMLKAHLVRRGFQVEGFGAALEAFDALRGDEFDAVVTDLNMAGLNGLELCERIVADRPEIPVLLITAFGSMDTAIAAIRAGAYDFVPKPFDMDVFVVALERAIAHRRLKEEVARLRRAVANAMGFGQMRGESAAMRRVYDLLERVKDADASVLVTGESGTGKELVARALHDAGRRRNGPFVAINCAAMPESLLESELFGHTRGAFTDARSARPGLFVKATGGTLFLDELGEMPVGLQPKLLRALQERRVRAVGSDVEVPFDARIVAATNRDLEAAVDARTFREDLYYRINVIHVDLPPLRARGNDVLVLAQEFLLRAAGQAGKSVSTMSAAVAERLLSYRWPGNVRELQNCMERGVVLAQYDELAVEDLPERIRNYAPRDTDLPGGTPDELLSMDQVERRHIVRVLEAVGGRKAEAARILGFDRTTLYRKLDRHGLADRERQ